MHQMMICPPVPDAGEMKMLRAIVFETVTAALTAGRSYGAFHGWQIQAWTSESRFLRRAHLRILYRDALWQQSDWILDWPYGGRTVH